jgi:hypothetical protein
MPKPTILIFTANDPDRRLNRLADEGKEILRRLGNIQGKQYEVYLFPDASTQDLVQGLKDFPATEIIHFAGHADEDHLHLTDGDAEAEALAERLRLNRNVKLVFLNGCATRAQKDFFHKSGVPFVIATSNSVGDEKAYWVARDFYQYLTLGRSLQSAFDAVKTDGTLKKEKIKLIRAAGRQAEESEAQRGIGIMPWGLYEAEGAEEKDFSLPIQRPVIPATDGVNHALFLRKLIYAMAGVDIPTMDAMRKLKVSLRAGGKHTETELKDELARIMPSPLAIRLQKILANPQESQKEGPDYYRFLLLHYASLFETLLHLQLSILVAQVLQVKKSDPAASLPEEMGTIQSFLRQDRRTLSAAAFVEPIEILAAWTRQFPQFQDIATPDNLLDYLHSIDFQEACAFFLTQKQYFNDHVRLEKEEAIRECRISQQYLERAVAPFGYLTRFTMASIGGFDIQNMRFVKTKYFNHVAKLVGEKAIYKTGDPREELLENKSVLFYPGPDVDITQPSLNLFPMIIDRNVFLRESEKVDLYLFYGYFQSRNDKQPAYYFSSLSDPSKIWRFDEEEDEISILHIDETDSESHRNIHLEASPDEIRSYLEEFKKHFLNTPDHGR